MPKAGGSPRPDRLAEVWSKGFLCDVLGMGAIWHFGWEANGESKLKLSETIPQMFRFLCVNDLIHGGLEAIQWLHPHRLAQRQHPRSRFQFQREVWPSFQSLALAGKLLAGKLVWSEFKTQRPAEFSRTHPSLGATPLASPQGERYTLSCLVRGCRNTFELPWLGASANVGLKYWVRLRERSPYPVKFG
jgi:hypothetical protein